MLNEGEQIHNSILRQVLWFHFITVTAKSYGPLSSDSGSATRLITYRLDEGGSYEGVGWPAPQPAGEAGAAGSWTSAPTPPAN